MSQPAITFESGEACRSQSPIAVTARLLGETPPPSASAFSAVESSTQ